MLVKIKSELIEIVSKVRGVKSVSSEERVVWSPCGVKKHDGVAM